MNNFFVGAINSKPENHNGDERVSHSERVFLMKLWPAEMVPQFDALSSLSQTALSFSFIGWASLLNAF